MLPLRWSLIAATIVDEHMPELLQVLQHFFATSPVAPRLRMMMQCCFGSSDHSRIDHPVLTGDAPREAGHRRSTKIVRNVYSGQPEPAVPT
jgi:hypothetical protein